MARFASGRLDRSVLGSLADLLGHRPTVLAWATTAGGWVVGLPGAMVLGAPGSWQRIAWHEIASGQWDSPTGRLSWVDSSGGEHSVALEAAGRFADLFNERVGASILLRRQVEVGAGQQVVLALRRNLEPGVDQTCWQVIPGPGVDLQLPAVSALVDQELAAAQADFGLA